MRTVYALWLIRVGDSSYKNHKDEINHPEHESGNERPPAPHFGFFGSLHRARHIARRNFIINLRGVDDRDDPERQTAKEGYKNRLNQIVRYCGGSKVWRVGSLRVGWKRWCTRRHARYRANRHPLLHTILPGQIV